MNLFILCGLSIFACALPAFLKIEYVGEQIRNYHENLNDIRPVVMGASLSFIMQFFTAMLFNLRIDYLTRFVVLIGIIGPTYLGYFLMKMPSMKNVEYLPVILNIRIMVIGYISLLAIYTYGKIWTANHIFSMALLIATSKISNAYRPYLMTNDSFLGIFELCQEVLFLAIFLNLAVNWFRNISRKSTLSDNDGACTFYIILVLVLTAATILVNIFF